MFNSAIRARLVLCPLLLGVVSSCTDNDQRAPSISVESERSHGLSWEEFRARALRPAVDGKAIFALSEDVFTDSEATLREQFDALTSAQDDPKLAVFTRLSTGFEPTFTGGNAGVIRYCVSTQFASFSPFSHFQMALAMIAATDAWQRLANVRFEYVPAQDGSCTESNPAVSFAVVPSTSTSYGGCGTNKLMWGNIGCPITGPYTASAAKGVLAVNLPYSQSSMPYISTHGLLLHELGHILGFRHEHPWGPACSWELPTSATDDVGGRRLTAYDQPSVMHYPVFCGKGSVDFSLSELDAHGARSVYGMPAAWHVALR